MDGECRWKNVDADDGQECGRTRLQGYEGGDAAVDGSEDVDADSRRGCRRTRIMKYKYCKGECQDEAEVPNWSEYRFEKAIGRKIRGCMLEGA